MDDHGIARRLGDVIQGTDAAQVARAATAITAARRVFGYGVGREGLAMRAIIMRLRHAGLDAYVVGEMVTAALGPSDLLIVSAGPKAFSTVAALVGVARDAGGSVLWFTAREDIVARPAQSVVRIPAGTMHTGDDPHPVLIMGSEFELGLWAIGDILAYEVRLRLGQDAAALTERHTNLE